MVKKKHEKIDKFAEREASKYESPIPSREFIIEHLAERARPSSYRQLLEELDLKTPEESEGLRRRLIAMVRDGQLHQNRRGAYGLIDKLDLIPGRVIAHKDGFGFIVPDDQTGDLFINARQMRPVFHGDRVLAKVSGMDQRGRREGVIVEVIERNTQHVVGRLIIEAGVAFVQSTNTRITQDILVPVEALNGATSGQMVVVEMVTYPSITSRPVGKIVEILGEHMAPGMEIDVAIRNHDLPFEWPEKALKEAARFPAVVHPEELKGRKDYRTLPFVTIDGDDAKDFDDAVFCAPHKEGFKLYVAIADVSHYVKPRTALDEEALNRGNSVYFPGRVIPMLPEILSNELCSLKPNVDRLTQVCEMTINHKGSITHFKFSEAVIHSKARLTYDDVFAAIVLKDETLQEKYKMLLPELQTLFEVYRVLHAARMRRGAIDFDLPETKIIFGKDRKIKKIIPLQRNDAHRLIEECMLCANICAARFLLKKESPGLYRIHQGPSLEKLMDLHKFLGQMGLKMQNKEEPRPKDYAKLLKEVESRPDAKIIQTVLLRSLSQAIYSHENLGHFGLAYEAYAHFTSPIRRYPDLLVHRAIHDLLHGKTKRDEKAYAHLAEMAAHASMTERRADEATREAMDWLKCEFMLDKVGHEYEGRIVGVTGFGIFVELKEVYVEGLVHITALKNDYYKFDSIRQALVGGKPDHCYRLGDELKIIVARVDLDERKIDFVLAEEAEDLPKKPKKKEKKSRKNKSRKKV